eukprot:3732379-Rhodomonas_salina.1
MQHTPVTLTSFLFFLNHTVFFHGSSKQTVHYDLEELVGGIAERDWQLIHEQLRWLLLGHQSQRNVAFLPQRGEVLTH